MNTFLSAFVYAVIGVIIGSTAAYYAHLSPVIGGAVGAVLGAGSYLVANRKP